MFRTFNMGIGFLVTCPKAAAPRLMALVPHLLQVGHVTRDRRVEVRLGDRLVEVEEW